MSQTHQPPILNPDPGAPSAAMAGVQQVHLGFQRVERDIRAIPERDLEPVNLDVPSAVATILGAVPEIMALRPIIATLPDFDLEAFDKLGDYALALGHAHSEYRAAAGRSDGISELATEI